MLFVVDQRSKLHTNSAAVPVWHTPVEVAEIRLSIVEWVRAVCARIGGNVLLLLWKY